MESRAAGLRFSRHLSEAGSEQFTANRPATISLAAVGLCITVPFLIPYHGYPLLTFYGEWTAIFLGLLAFGPLLTVPADKLPRLPWISIGLIGFCVLLYLQIGLGTVAYPQRSVTGVMYALWAALVAWLGVWLRDSFGLSRAMLVLAAFLAAGSWLLAITGFMQYFSIQTAWVRFIEPAPQVGMYGVLAQRNLFANYVACGLLATGWLFSRRHVGLVTATLVGVTLAAALAFSGARSAWIYVGVIGGFFLWNRRTGSDGGDFRGVIFAAIALLVFAAVRLGPASEAVPRADDLAPWEWLPYRTDDFTQVPIAPRLLLAWHALIQFSSHPVMGVGFGEFAWNLFQNTLQLDGHLTPGIDRHSHNIVLQLLAETGILGLALVGGALVSWMAGLRAKMADAAVVFALSIFVIQIMHSLVEFPLWYAQFLGLTALLIGMTSREVMVFGRSALGRTICWSVFAGGLAISALYFKGYRDYENWYLGTVAAEKSARLDPAEQVDNLLGLEYSWMFLPYFDLVITEGMAINPDNLDLKLAVNGRAMRLFPIPSAVARQAMLLSMAGREDEAWSTWRRLRIIFPAFEVSMRKKVLDYARLEPGLAPLAGRIRADVGRL